ncbi:MAG: beta-ketoacyl synthase [Geobacter sp.]|nr:beta-ketoacyl synthase [Geobacter sp.]
MNWSEVDIVITGMAAISAAGVGLDPMRAALESGQSCLTPVPADVIGEEGHLWGRAEGFKATDFLPPLKARKLDRCSQFATVAAGQALKHAGIDPAALDPTRIGIILGCGFGGIANSVEFLSGYYKGGVEGLSPMFFPNTVANAAASNASIEHGLKGPNVTIVQRFCSAEEAVMMACHFIRAGRADVVLAGGVDEVNPLMIQGFKAMGQLGSYAAGFGEGSGILVLERREHAEKRQAAILGTVDTIATAGLLAGNADPARERLLAGSEDAGTISLSGTADMDKELTSRLASARRIELHGVTGRSIAMGGLALTALILSLRPGERGFHLAASPEGPFFSINLTGGSGV